MNFREILLKCNGKLKEEFSCRYNMRSVQIPRGRDLFCIFLPPATGREILSNSANERLSKLNQEQPLCYELPVFANAIFVYNSPSQLPLLYEFSLLYFMELASGSPYLHALYSNALLLWIKPLYWKNQGK